MEEDEKEVRSEKNYIGLWALLLGLPLGLTFTAMFYVSGLYLTMGKDPLFKLFDDTPNIPFLLITLPWSIAYFAAAIVGAAKLARKNKNTRPIKIAIANMIDLSIILNATAICMGILLYHTFDPLYSKISYLALPVATWISLLPPIVGVPVILDFLMPRLWKTVFGHKYGFFEGKLLKNLQRSWKGGELQREFSKRVKLAFVVLLLTFVVLMLLALLGFLS